MVDNKGFTDFLIRAKINTYAGSATTSTAPFPNSKMLTFKDENLVYQDVYFGMNQFAGQEVVSLDNKPIWSMVYSSQQVKNGHENEVYNFLKKALLKIPNNAPYRGPSDLIDGSGLRYQNSPTGDISLFSGVESIWHEEVLLYRLHYSGGWIL
ncbi:DUF5680 domain-containing protein [Providencia sp. Me31A]|uniref:DUF5680 domain-containing protein n=1 Tax=Providencia sp. Me31A TaxID=3392637 RepID=UPI003D2A8A3E